MSNLPKRLFNSSLFDKGIAKWINGIFKGLFLCVCGVSIIAAVYLISIHSDLITWPVVLTCSLFSSVMIMVFYSLHKANMNNSPEDIKREKMVMGDVAEIKSGRYSNVGSTLGKWYMVAALIVICLPIAAKILAFSSIPSQIQMEMILYTGLIMIIVFIVGMVWTNRKNKHKSDQ